MLLGAVCGLGACDVMWHLLRDARVHGLARLALDAAPHLPARLRDAETRRGRHRDRERQIVRCMHRRITVSVISGRPNGGLD